MGFEQEPQYEPPSEFMRSAALFIFTMGTVFGLGMAWTNYGDQITRRWNKDWNGMKESWTQATTPPEREPGSGLGLFGLMKENAWNADRIGYEMRPADNSRLRSDRPVVPMIDRNNMKLKNVNPSRGR